MDKSALDWCMAASSTQSRGILANVVLVQPLPVRQAPFVATRQSCYTDFVIGCG